jgi:1-deoxy-D-xylulose-5-phosphate synthase
VHKILTGRKDRFDTLRQGGGLSGFTNRDESEYDCFGAGHSSTSISAALGFAEADKLNGSDAYTVAVVGDGAFTGGMIHEALNNYDNDLKLIIVINENEMSISKNIGRFATNMSKLRTGKGYLKTKRATRNFVKKIPLIGNWLFKVMRDTKKCFKNLVYGSNYFEDMGLYYLGPVDGHNIASLERLLNEAKKTGRGAVIHVKTVKGKGFEPAENDPGRYHGMAAEKVGASNDGKTFVRWECEGCEISDVNSPEAEVTLSGDCTIKAVFS